MAIDHVSDLVFSRASTTKTLTPSLTCHMLAAADSCNSCTHDGALPRQSLALQERCGFVCLCTYLKRSCVLVLTCYFIGRLGHHIVGFHSTEVLLRGHGGLVV